MEASRQNGVDGESQLQTNTTWGSQDLNSILDLMQPGTSPLKGESDNFLGSPRWRTLLGIEDDTPMHTNDKLTPFLQNNSKRRREDDTDDDLLALTAGYLASPTKLPKHDEGQDAPDETPQKSAAAPSSSSGCAAERGAGTWGPATGQEYLGERCQLPLGGTGREASAAVPPAPHAQQDWLHPLPPGLSGGLPSTGNAFREQPASATPTCTPLFAVDRRGQAVGLHLPLPPCDAVARVQLLSPTQGLAYGQPHASHPPSVAAMHPWGHVQAHMTGKIAPLPAVPTPGHSLSHPSLHEEAVGESDAQCPTWLLGSHSIACPAGAEGQAENVAYSQSGTILAPWEAAQPVPPPRQRQQPLATKSSKAVPNSSDGLFTSKFRGVTKHKLTGRFEAHFWDASFKRATTGKGGRTRGKQVYLGGYATEDEAARAYDKAALAHMGSAASLNFFLEDYSEFLESIEGKVPEEVVGELRRGSVGFARGQSQYRGVTKHHHQGKWEARIGRVDGNKYMYLGTFDSAEDAARAYDRAAVKFRGRKAMTNFNISQYSEILADPDAYNLASPSNTSKSSEGSHQEKSGHGLAQASSQSSMFQQAQHWSEIWRDGVPVVLPSICPATYSAAFAQTAQLPMNISHGGIAGVQMPMHGTSAMTISHPEAEHYPPCLEWSRQVVPGQAPVWECGTPPATASAASPPPLQPLPLLGPQVEAPGVSVTVSRGDAGCITDPSCSAGLLPIPKLPAIRVRRVAEAAEAAPMEQTHLVSTGQGLPALKPLAGQLSLELAGLSITPLAADLLSPLGISGEGGVWSTSPLARELSRMSQEDLCKLFGGDLSVFNSPTKSSTSSRSSGQGSDLWAAIQWLERLDPGSLSSLAPTPTSTLGRSTQR